MHRLVSFAIIACVGTCAWESHASTGADGPFAPVASLTLPLPASGVFNFTSITIPAGVTVRFTRNATNTPVTLLATGNVAIAGVLDVSGGPGGNGVGSVTSLASNAGAGGPGGFDGGAGTNGIASIVGGNGLGPGGGDGSAGSGGGGGFGAPGANAPSGGGAGGGAYGTDALLPMIGGSGGAGGGAAFGATGAGGGGGGGALVIATAGNIHLTGVILARGGNGGGAFAPGGGGSGGAVRLVASSTSGTTGSIDVRGGAAGAIPGITSGGAGGAGRVRIEAVSQGAAINFNTVPPSAGLPTSVTLPDAPALSIVSVGGIGAPPAPGASYATPDVVLPASTPNPVTVVIAGANVPPGIPVSVRVVGQTGGATSATATLAGSLTSSTASASVTVPTNRPSVISASVTFTLSAATGTGPVFVHGEEVEAVRVSTRHGGGAELTYIMRSGREIVSAGR
jgi:hypothetical protein